MAEPESSETWADLLGPAARARLSGTTMRRSRRRSSSRTPRVVRVLVPRARRREPRMRAAAAYSDLVAARGGRLLQYLLGEWGVPRPHVRRRPAGPHPRAETEGVVEERAAPRRTPRASRTSGPRRRPRGLPRAGTVRARVLALDRSPAALASPPRTPGATACPAACASSPPTGSPPSPGRRVSTSSSRTRRTCRSPTSRTSRRPSPTTSPTSRSTAAATAWIRSRDPRGAPRVSRGGRGVRLRVRVQPGARRVGARGGRAPLPSRARPPRRGGDPAHGDGDPDVTARRRAPIAAAIAFALLSRNARAEDASCAALAPARREAVRRGAKYLKIFFESEENRAALGTDAVSIFLELGETAKGPKVGEPALAEARRLAAPLVRAYAKPGALDGPAAHDSLIGALSLLPDSRPLHLSKKSSLSLLSSLLSRLEGRDPDETYYGERFDAARLGALDGDTLFNLLVDAYTVERARLAFPALPAPAVGLGDVLSFVRTHPSPPCPGRRRGRLLPRDARRVVCPTTRGSASRPGPRAGPAVPRAQVPAPRVARHGAAAEIADVLRQTGAVDSDPDVCRLTRLLLATQGGRIVAAGRPGHAVRRRAPDVGRRPRAARRRFLPAGAWAPASALSTGRRRARARLRPRGRLPHQGPARLEGPSPRAAPRTRRCRRWPPRSRGRRRGLSRVPTSPTCGRGRLLAGMGVAVSRPPGRLVLDARA